MPAEAEATSPGKEAAAYMLVGATAYRMLASWPPHTVQKDDVVLVWGGSGGLGSPWDPDHEGAGRHTDRRRLER